MAKEIERKYLVRDNSYQLASTPVLYMQGYLSNNPERVVRVRVAGNKGYLTIKGKNDGITRMEFEYEIPAADAEQILHNLCEDTLIEKNRYRYEYKGCIWEIDEFLGNNEGLVIAEVELDSEEKTPPKPEWVGDEVSGNPRYYNSNLSINPYRNWR